MTSPSEAREGESGFGTGRRSSSERSKSVRSPVPSVQLVDAISLALLTRLPNRFLLPAIGEAISIDNADNLMQSYRVVDVVWNYHHDADGATLAGVLLKVTREASAENVKQDL